MSKKAFGLTTKRMASAFIITPTVQFIRVTGRTIISTERVLKSGQMDKSFKVHISRAKNKVRESTSGLMGALTKASGMIIESRVSASTNGPMVANTKALSKTVKCLDKARIHGPMAGHILAHT